MPSSSAGSATQSFGTSVSIADRSVGAAGNIGTVVQVHAHSARVERARALRVVSPQVQGFTEVIGRDDLLVLLRNSFSATDRAPGRPVLRVLVGLGGVGKTSVARAYAARHLLDYGLIWWVRAEDPSAVPGEFRALLEQLAPDDAGTVSDPIRAAQTILANRAGRWLLVLDNLPTSDALRGLRPAVGDGDILVTTRARDWPDRRALLPISPLADPAAILLLTTLSGDSDQSAASDLAVELGGLPLALAQAGAYTAHHDLRLGAYLNEFRKRRPSMLAEGRAADYDATVATTWQLAFEQLTPAARSLLNLLAWYAADSIPVGVLFTGLSGSIRLPGETGLLEDLLGDDLAVRDALTVLVDHSLLIRSGAGDAAVVSVHRLVQAFTVDHLTAAGRAPDWLTAAAKLLLAAIPEPPATLATINLCLRLQTHARTLIEHLPPEDHTSLNLRRQIASWTAEVGDAAGGRRLYARLLDDCLAVLGHDHPDTLEARDKLAVWTGEIGDAATARQLFATVLEDRLRLLGPDHPDTLSARSRLAEWTGRVGNVTAAQQLCNQLLHDQIRVLGAEHRSTLEVRSDVARWTGQAGQAALAQQLFAKLLNDRIRLLGPDHPDTLSARHNLAFYTNQAGDKVGARDLYSSLLEDRRRVLGPDNPRTLLTRSNRAALIGEMGDAADALRLFLDLLDDRVRVLGPDHPQSLMARAAVARWTGRAGDADAAREECTNLHKDRLRVLGPDHPSTLKGRFDLAHWTAETGRVADARQMLADLLSDGLGILGPDHPQVLAVRTDVARLTFRDGEIEAAEQLYVDVLRDCLRIFGSDHPQTLATQVDLARLRRETGAKSTGSTARKATSQDGTPL